MFCLVGFPVEEEADTTEKFLAETKVVMPWTVRLALIEPRYPKTSRRGRPAMPLQSMLRIYFMPQWFAMSDRASEDALYKIEAMRRFAGLEFIDDALPDESTVLRHLLERHHLTKRMLGAIHAVSEERGAILQGGTIVDSTILDSAHGIEPFNLLREDDQAVFGEAAT